MFRRVITTFFLLAMTTHVTAQYIDFFQGFSSFLQPYQTTRRNDVTKRPAQKQTTKPRYQDTIFFATDDLIRQKATTSTTVKPKKKPKTTTGRPSTRSPWIIESNDNNNFYGTTNRYIPNVYDTNGQITNNNRQTDNANNKRVDNSNREIENNWRFDDQNRRENENNVYNANIYNYEVSNANNNRQTTHKPYNNNFGIAQKPIHSRPSNNRHTTINPLLYRPGVKPAVVDDNRPPITNKPVTNRPVYTLKPVIPNEFDANDDSDPVIKIGPDEDEMSEAEKRKYYEIAEQKCDEYKSLNTKKVVALPLAGGHGVELNVSTCKPITIPLIIGGKVVSIEEFPHMGLIGWRNLQNDGFSWKCGGSLISEQFVLTAGHCTYHDKDYNVVSGPPHAVQLGSSYLDGGDALVVSISAVIRHPKYKMRRSYYDVALIKLATTVKFSKSIRPACLGAPPPAGDRFIATGWGRTEFGGDSSRELRSVSVPIWDMAECRAVWGTSRKLPEGPSPASQVCAGERGGGKDTCQGDSGGPAQVQDGCTWRVVAVTSVGRSCGAAETPALYAKVPRAFIASQVFTNVKINNNKGNSNNGNNWGVINNNNNNANQFNTQNSGNNNQFGNNQGNGFTTQNFGNNNQGNGFTTQNFGNINQFGNNNQGNGFTTQNSGSNNNQNFGNNNNFGSQFGNSDSNREIYKPVGGVVSNNNRFGNSQSTGIRDRPGNHQTDRREVISEGVYNNNQNTNREPIVSGPASQTVEDNNRRVNNKNNQNNNRNPESQDSVYRPGNHQRVENNNQQTYNSNKNGDVIKDTNTWGTNSRPEANRDGQYNYDNHRTTTVKYYSNNNRESYNQNNNAQKVRTTEGYFNVGVQNSDYFTTENPYNRNNGYNQNNNGYNQFNNGYNNNNNEYIVASRPWWNR